MKNRSKKVVVLNATFDGSTHEIIDSSIIIMLSHIYSKVLVRFLASRSNIIGGIVNQFGNDNANIDYKSFNNDLRKGAFHDLKAAMLEALTILFGSKDTLYVTTFNNMFSCHLNNLISRLTGKKIIMFCHSEVNVITGGDYKISQYWAYLINRFFKKTSLGRNVKLVVLGDHILNQLPHYIKKERLSHFYSIDHPYFTNKNKISDPTFSSKEVKIGVIGGVSKNSSHGYNNILDFANSIINNNNNIRIYLISSVEREIRNTFPSNVTIVNKEDGYLPREEYEKNIDKMDYILLPYSSTDYNLIASGAVLEAIIRLKPTIMFPNNYFKYLSNKYGKFGVFVEDRNFERLTQDLLSVHKYEGFRNKEHEIADKLNPLNMISSFQQIIKV